MYKDSSKINVKENRGVFRNNGQSREMGNTGYPRYRKKTNKTKNTT